MTCGITVAPTIETASSAAPPGSRGVKHARRDGAGRRAGS